jgi:hypothetical protein
MDGWIVKYALPFRYPSSPVVRKHGPQGYSSYKHHRPWLRDEFDFRCVYCLKREQWCFQLNDFELDHLVAQSIDASLCRDYMNLVYACHNCNQRKGNKSLPSPDKVAYGACMEVLPNGKIIAHNDDGIRLIDELGLDQQKITATRCLFIQSIRSHQIHNWKLFLMWMGFPQELPDLSSVLPQPRQNTRPLGIGQSWFRRKPLPEYYE